ncbi:MAG TPA: hypothetical protein ENJ18_04785 [Nannocystis exedens]|nr:hypothetical protein [Nannocystis exedens]
MPEKIKKASRVVMKTLRTNPDMRKVALKELGADDETVAMVEELDAKIAEVGLRNPDVVAAWGLGCGGVSC